MIITGGGSGIGRALVQHFSAVHHILTCGRRIHALEETKSRATNPERVHIVQADLAIEEDRERFISSLHNNNNDNDVTCLIQNAAIGDPAAAFDDDIDISRHLEEALQVNVVAPLALARGFMPALTRGNGRILHLGTSVAFRPQEGTLVYGVTKMAFHRLYQQINVEKNSVPCGSISPGMVDTEGVLDHWKKARDANLPHVRYFEEAYQDQRKMMTPMSSLMHFFEDVLEMDETTFSSREWNYREWASSSTHAEKEREHL